MEHAGRNLGVYHRGKVFCQFYLVTIIKGSFWSVPTGLITTMPDWFFIYICILVSRLLKLKLTYSYSNQSHDDEPSQVTEKSTRFLTTPSQTSRYGMVKRQQTINEWEGSKL